MTVPWLVFSTLFFLNGFWPKYHYSHLVWWISIVACIYLAIRIFRTWGRKRFVSQGAGAGGPVVKRTVTVPHFIAWMCFVSAVLGIGFGNYTFWTYIMWSG